MELFKIIIRRSLISIISLFLVITIVFGIIHFIPGSPFASENNVSQEVQENILAKYGLNKPLSDQYFQYLGNILRGDFGISLKSDGRTVNNIIKEHLPLSMIIGIVSLILCICIAIPFGIIAALHEGRKTDIFLKFFSIITISSPLFVISVIFQYIFCVKLKWFPAVNFNGVDSIILPIIILSLYPFATIFQLVRSNMIEELKKDYIIVAKQLRIPQKKIIIYAFKNISHTVISYLGPTTVNVLTGSFVVEKVFGVPGIGRYFIVSVLDRDYTTIMGLTVLFAIMMIFANLCTDILCKIINPRINIQ